MKNLKYVALLIATAMFLAACGGAVDSGPTTGSLAIDVTPNSAQVMVMQGDNNVATQTGDFTVDDLDPGTYAVSATAAGYLDYGPQSVVVSAGETTTFSFTMTEEAQVGANVENLALSFVDVDGNAYDTNQEINPVKDATLVAAQTEEMVGVSVLVTDADGLPVPNAPVTVNVTGDFSDALAIYAGQPLEGGSITVASNAFTGLMTDADGMAYFIIEATNDDISIQELLNLLFNELGDFDEVLSIFEPTKLIVSAVGANNVAKRVEFKSWFTNMSHLWYAEGDDELERRVGDGPYGEVVYLDTDSLVYTDQRLGADLGTVINIWRQTGPVDRNVHYFGTMALTKQPSSGPFRVGVGTFENWFFGGPVNGDVGLAGLGYNGYPETLSGVFPGYMEYVLSDVSTDENGDPLVEWDPAFCEELSADGMTCIDWNGSGVGLVPVTGVSLEDLPIEATVTATYYFTVSYGDEIYEFALKDYTFTKQWVGGFLTVDKYVDQHVLTWAGPAITLAASSQTYAEEYTSTVNVTVSNDSDADIYNVTIRDAVPAELGVVTDSISNGGTYDPINHVVTWNYTTTPSLENVNVGESFTFTFDVYARQKPGYCWASDEGGNYNVQPRASDPVQDADYYTCANPYEDPFLVTNGQQPNSVTAAGFFEDTVAGEQLVFSYVPEADESDIWTVRPLLEVDKTLRSADVMTQGASATFSITARQTDRVSTVVDPGNTEYAFLNVLYPWEFDGALAAGDGHIASAPVPGTESMMRDNPYARDVALADAWEVGIDFTNGTSFTLPDGESGGVLNSIGAVVNKEVSWSPISNLPRGFTAEAILTLTGNLLSDDGDGNPLNNSDVDTTDASQTTQGLYHWDNCAYLGAPQLNQPFPASTGEYPSTWYAEEFITPWQPWFQIDGVDVLANELVSDAAAATDNTRTYANADGRLEACDSVVVIPPPPTPFVTLTTNGEYTGPDRDGSVENSGVPEITPANLYDGYTVNDIFVYKLTIQNSGGAAAQNVTFSASLTNGTVRFDGTAALYRDADGDFSAGESLVATVPLNNAGSFSFAGYPLAAGEFFRVVIETEAQQIGQVDMIGEVIYDNPATQSLPLQTTEETSVQAN